MAKRKISFVLFLILSFTLTCKAQEVKLEDLINTALKNSQNVRTAILDDSIADERITEIKSNMLPQVSVNGDYKYYSQIPVQLISASIMGGPPNYYVPFEFGVPWNLGTTFSLGQLLFSQEYITGVKMAKTGKELSELSLKKTKEELVYNLSASYYNAQIINAQMDFIRGNITNISKLIETGKLLYENQMIKYSDVEKLQLNKTMLETQEQTLAVTYSEIINLLKFLAGIPQPDSLKIDNNITTKADIFRYTKIKPDRTEVRLLEKKKELYEIERKNIFAGYLPTLSAYGIYNYTFFGKGGGADLFKGYPASWFGLQLKWNIFDGLNRKSRMEQKDIELKKIDLQMNQLNENISMEMNNAMNQIILQRSTIQNRKEQLSLAEKLYDQTQLQFKEGLVTITDVIQSENSLKEAQNNYIVSIVKLLYAQLSWNKAAGKLINK